MNYEEQAALDAVRGFLDSYAHQNIGGCMAALAMTKPILFMGTNDNEIFRTPNDLQAAFGRDFSRMSDMRWGEPRTLHVEASPVLASVLVEMPIHYRNNGTDFNAILRYALTLTKEREQWKLCSGMASIPFAPDTFPYSG